MKERGSGTLESCGVIFHGDLDKYTYEYFDYLVELSSNYENGILPSDGPYSRQPAQIIEGLNIMSQLKFETQQQQQREIEKKQKASARKK